jgi:hypothetical protein
MKLEESTSHQNTPQKPKASFSQLMLELGICIILPTMILKKLSGDEHLGPTWSLVLALALPLGFAIYNFYQERKFGLVPVLGFINILLTGVIGLLKLPTEYIAIKEATVPFVIGVATLISLKTPYPLVKTFLYNDLVMQTDKVNAALAEKNQESAFEKVLKNATYMIAFSFLVSSILNYVLAVIIVTEPAGTEAFNDQLGTMTLYSYPVIVLPCMVITIYAMFYLFKNIKKLTGLELEEILNQA